MANIFAALKTGAYWCAKEAGKEVINQITRKATPEVVTGTKAKVMQICKYCVNTPNPYDDVIAIFLCDLFEMELPEKDA